MRQSLILGLAGGVVGLRRCSECTTRLLRERLLAVACFQKLPHALHDLRELSGGVRNGGKPSMTKHEPAEVGGKVQLLGLLVNILFAHGPSPSLSHATYAAALHVQHVS